MTQDEAFAAVGHAFPQEAEWQGLHFRFAAKAGVVLIEQRRSTFVAESSCAHCGQDRGRKDTRYFYWLIWEGNKKVIHASFKSKFGRMRTVIDSLSMSENYS